MSDPIHEEEYGHWDVADIRRLLYERDAMRAKLARYEEALRELEQHHAKINDAIQRPQSRSKTLSIIRRALEQKP